MKRTIPALLLLAIWTSSLVVLGIFVQRQLSIGTDLRLFLPNPTTPEQRLLLEGIGEGPASRVLVVALGGARIERLADVSQALAEALRESEYFRFVTNGELALDAFPDELLPYRFLLSPTLDQRRFDADYLGETLRSRVRDLASPAGIVLEPWIARDPTLELLALLQRWQPMHEPRREFDVWFDRAGERALLIAETHAAAFDPNGQRTAIAELERILAVVSEQDAPAMTVSGAGNFSVIMEERTRAEAVSLGRTATIAMIVLLLAAYRRVGCLVLSSLPIVSAGLAGLAAVSALFGSVHGITLAFGFTLIGVAQDYPIHLLSHGRAGVAPREIARSLWPTLATGIASTCIAYLTFFFSGVIGLAQLACFAVTGLAVAGMTTRFLVPMLMDPKGRDYGDSAFLDRLWRSIASLPRPPWAGIGLILLCIALIALAPRPLWENDLGELTPVPDELLAQDQALRAELGTPDLRYLLVVDDESREAALTRLEALDPQLQRMVERGAITGYDHAARYVPSVATQRARQAQLPVPQVLRAALAEAQAQTPFRPGVFESFVEDIERARTAAPLTVEQMLASPLGTALEMLLIDKGEGATAVVTFSGVSDPSALRGLAVSAGAATLLDLKEASATLVAQQRTRILWSLAIASVLLVGVVAFALRSWTRVCRVIVPMAITTLVVIAALQTFAVSLSLFHLISLILAGGLGLDYALFFEHAADDPAEQRRTLHAILVCALSTLMVFVLLATSSLPVLRAIGAPVAIGVVSNFVLALLLTRPARSEVRAV
jgi:predicted exporter